MTHKHGSIYHVADYLSGPIKYLGRFMSPDILKRGHNRYDEVAAEEPKKPKEDKSKRRKKIDEQIEESGG